MSLRTTNAYGLTMDWSIARASRYNAANPFVIVGYINGECRMSHAISAETAKSFEHCESRVTSRLKQISEEKAV